MDKLTHASGELDFLYQEYVRLSHRLDTIIDSSWDDFKLLGASSALIAWPPLAQSDLFSRSDSCFILFVGFIGILFIMAIIGMRDLIKQSLMQHYLFELRRHEEEIRAKLPHVNSQGFRFASHWLNHSARVWQAIVSRFYGLFYLFLFFFPVGVLVANNACWPYAIAYGIAMLINLGIYLNALKQLDHGWKEAKANEQPSSGK
jgi:hypothetical protein